jgi:hypothetical protein
MYFYVIHCKHCQGKMQDIFGAIKYYVAIQQPGPLGPLNFQVGTGVAF